MSLHHEIRFHRTLVGSAGASVRPHVPRIVVASPDERLLVVEGLPRHRNLLDRVLDGDVAALPEPAALAGFLADLHHPSDHLPRADEPTGPPVLTFGSIGPGALVARPPSHADLLRTVQPSVDGAPRALRSHWSPRTLVHGNLSGANELVEPDRPGSFAVVDCGAERAGGDPPFDVRALTGSLIWAAANGPGSDRRAVLPAVTDWAGSLLTRYIAAARERSMPPMSWPGRATGSSSASSSPRPPGKS
ncbi:hypothetical protein AB0M28_31345 [Streptomyces sp. NPDC051940]|uniref:hypothetical protein n=1 Tax=Streptomyces sp. NPDC051940 TaxID=3155675 RepID=UPI00342A42FB